MKFKDILIESNVDSQIEQLHKKIKEYVDKKNNLDYKTQKQNIRWYQREIDKMRNKIFSLEQKSTANSSGMDIVKKILKSHGLRAAKRSSTAIRGYTVLSGSDPSYEWDKFSPKTISFHYVSDQLFDKIKKDIDNHHIKFSGDRKGIHLE